jgi:hypothetical protein
LGLIATEPHIFDFVNLTDSTIFQAIRDALQAVYQSVIFTLAELRYMPY